MKTPRTFKGLCADSRVEDYSDERSQGIYNEGIWLYLMPGWVTPEGLTQIHEQTVRECSSELAGCYYQPGLPPSSHHPPLSSLCFPLADGVQLNQGAGNCPANTHPDLIP